MAPIVPFQQKLKTYLKMSISRLRHTQQKQAAIQKQQRRNIATILKEGKESTARIKIENIINEDIHLELLELLELYCELLLARIMLISDPVKGEKVYPEIPEGLEEAIQSVVHSAPFSEVKELVQVRDLLLYKYGKEMDQSKIPEKIKSKCAISPPSEELCVLYLKEIARAYDAPYSELSDEEEEEEEEEENQDGKAIVLDESKDGIMTPTDQHPIVVKGSEVKVPKEIKADVTKKKQDPLEELRKRFEALRR